MKKTTQPADTYTIINKTIITEKDKKVITMLYQPIIGHVACSLYFTLITDLDKQEIMSEDLTHHHLMTTMQLKLDDIIVAREKLEAIGLLKSYVKEGNINQYVYMLFSPLEPSEFFSHPILNIVLYNNVGKSEYDKIVSEYKYPKINLKDYTEITSSFDKVFSPVKGNIMEQEEILLTEKRPIEVQNRIDFDLIISALPSSQISDKCFTNDIRNLINQLSYIYDINTLEMQGIIRECINERGLIDKTEIRKKCRDYYKFENFGNLPTLIYNKQPDFLKKPEGDSSKWAKMIYTFENITPIQFLRAKYKGAEPTDRDKRLVESLMVDQKLNPGVVNVLLSYVLKTNREQLTKSYVETIAGQWKRSNIETVEDAMKFAEKEHKKMKKAKEGKTQSIPIKEKQVQQVPAWFQSEQTLTETTEEEVEELDKILNELI